MSQESEPGGDLYNYHIDLRYIERDLLLQEALVGQSKFERWLLGYSDPETHLQTLAGLISDEVADYDWTANLARQVIHQKLAAARGATVPAIVWPEDLEPEWITLAGEYEAYVYTAALNDSESPEIEAHLSELRRTVLQRSLLGVWLNLGIILAMVALIAWYLVERTAPERSRDWLFFKRWEPGVVVSAFVTCSLFVEISMALLLIGMALVGEIPGGAYPIIDVVFRSASSILLGIYFFRQPLTLFRVFGVFRKIEWAAVLGLLGAIHVLSIILFNLGIHGELDPTNYFADPDPPLIQTVGNIVSAVVAAPLFEEIVFRGFLFLGLMKRLGTIPAALLSSTLFALLHVQYDWITLIHVGIVGLACCWLTWRTRSLASSILLHAIHNALITWWVWLIYQKPLF